MTKTRVYLIPLLLVLLAALVGPVHAQSGIQVVKDQPTLQFPNTLTFQAEFTSGAKITSVVLDYGVDQQTCGKVIAEGYPDVTSGTDVSVSWTWDMRESGSEPPGATIWWYWVVQDESGVTFTSPQKTLLWLDSVHPWQTISGGNINLHYYSGGSSFGQTLHDAAAQALVRLANDVGLQPDQPIDIYIYASTQDMQDAILYEPSWTGGEAFPDYNIVIIGITPSDLDWGKATEAHELTHVLVGHLTFSCLSFIPTWLNEGLAMYGEGGLQPDQQAVFNQAVASDSLPSLRSLGGEFSGEADEANLAYGVSYSVVDFLILKDGQAKMISLLDQLRDGATADQALSAVYGFNTDGLDAVWRASIGVPALTENTSPTAVPTPTIIPTLVPFAGPLAVSPNVIQEYQGAQTTAALQPTATPVSGSPVVTGTTTPVPLLEWPLEQLGLPPQTWAWLGYGLVCLILLLVVIIGPILILARRRSGRSK
jgi:hypothetical protein